MSIALITGSAGLIGSEASLFFAELGLQVIGIDNDMRRVFFGDEASTVWQRRRLELRLNARYRHIDADVRNYETIREIFSRYSGDIKLVIHAAAQPSHDWAAKDPRTDFDINASGTLNLLEATRRFAPDAVFIFTSTNKVYGDTPNRLPLIEEATRWEIDPGHIYNRGINEDMPIDKTLHSIFGASKVAADIMVQEYGRYFGLFTGCFRGGCLTGPNHSPAQLHGFLAYLMKCTAAGIPYQVMGYQGKQVRDNIHSSDLIRAFYQFFKTPRRGEVYNIGGGRFSHCSILEAIDLCRVITGRDLNWTYRDDNRIGDHIWWVSDLTRFKKHYPQWSLHYDVPGILREIYQANSDRWRPATNPKFNRIEAPPRIDASRAGSKRNLLGVLIDAVDYQTTVNRVISAAIGQRPLAVSALAVHGVMTGVLDSMHRYRLNHLDLVVPDGQPVRWALNLLYQTGLPDRVYGPNLMLRICEKAAEAGLPVYLYGSREEVLNRLVANLRARFQGLIIAGSQPSRFAQISAEAKSEIIDRIRESGAALTFVGLGCPRQEIWIYEYKHDLNMPLIAVGAAFDFHAGAIRQAPRQMQDLGLEWLYRLVHEPGRLWRRYLALNPLYLALLFLQASGLRRFDPLKMTPPINELRYG